MIILIADALAFPNRFSQSSLVMPDASSSLSSSEGSAGGSNVQFPGIRESSTKSKSVAIASDWSMNGFVGVSAAPSACESSGSISESVAKQLQQCSSIDSELVCPSSVVGILVSRLGMKDRKGRRKVVARSSERVCDRDAGSTQVS